MDREALHREVHDYVIGDWRVRAILHAMIDAGTITVFECAWDECVMADRAFTPRVVGEHSSKGGKCLVIDHIVPRLQGGSDRPENLRILHGSCNNAVSRGWKMSEEAKEKIRQAAIARGGWKDALEKRRPGYNRKKRADDGRKGGNRPRALTDEQVLEARRRHRAGETYKAIAESFECSETPVMWAVRRLRTYANVLPGLP